MMTAIFITLLAAIFALPAEGSGYHCLQAGNIALEQGDEEGNALSAFVSRMASSSAVFSYGYVVDDGRAKVTGDGTVVMQGESYVVKGNGLEVYCDGQTRWTVDRESLEVVIESYDPENPDYTVNPAVLLRHFDKVFSVAGRTRAGSAYDYRLVPSSSETDISEMGLKISEDGMHLVSASMKMKNGTAVSFTFPSFSFSPVPDVSCFSFDISSLSSDYIITDLR